MKCHPERWIWGLIPIAMLTWIAVQMEADRIELDLERRARAALLARGHEWASVVFSGRDGILVGTPGRPGAREEALSIVRDVWGVRAVARHAREEAEPLAQRGLPGHASPGAASRRADRAPGIAREVAEVAPPIEVRPPAVSGAAPPVELGPSAAPGAAPTDLRPSAVRGGAPAALRDVSPETVRAYDVVLPVAAKDAAKDAPQDAVKDDAGGRQATPSPGSSETGAVAAAAPPGACEEAKQLGAPATIHFSRGRARLNRRDRQVLDRLAAAASACPRLALTVTGHADARGTARRNLALSERRARVVVSYLITKGIDAGRLKAVGYGDTRPVVPNDTARHRALNRRIEIEFTGLDGS